MNLNNNFKKPIFYLISILLVIFISCVIILSSFILTKLSKSYSYCNSYGEKDIELGWVLKKSHMSCLSFNNYLLNKTYFDTSIYLNQYGFRDSDLVNNKSPDIIFIGDSWTFGYGVNYEDTFSAIIAKKTGLNVLNMGVPNYSSLQTLYLTKRFISKFQPKIIVFLNPEIMSRALCSKKNYKLTLEPCYTIIGNEVKIIFPDEDFLNNSIANNKYPSGFHTAGYNFFQYYFVYKPLNIFDKILLKIGLKSNQNKPDVKMSYFNKRELEMLISKELDLISSISSNNTKFVNIMMATDFYNLKKINEIENNYNFSNFDHNWYKLNIISKLDLIKNNGKIEKDGHYNEEANEIIADAIISELF